MAEEKNADQGFNIQETFSKTENFIENNGKKLSIIGIALVVIVGGYFGYKYLIVAPQEKEAQSQMYMAQRYFEQDSLKKAIDGDGNFQGFKAIIEDYSVTQSANLAHYYLGLAYLKKGEYQNAIDALDAYSAKDDVTGILAVGAMGDAYMELGKADDAISNYKKAAGMDSENNFTSALFMKKAATAMETQGKYAEALELYKTIQEKYFETTEGRDMDKYISRASAMVK